MSERLDIEQLATRVLSDSEQPYSAVELDAMLSWLAGSERAGGGELIRRIGTAKERPDLLRSVYRHLDERLFEDGKLDLRRAHVDAGIDDKTRRARFRRLMTAFHPDRSQEHSDWLTPRSQAVLAAYGVFRRGGPTPEHRPMPRSAAPRGHRTTRDVARSSARLTPSPPTFWLSLQQRMRRTSHLQAKIMLGLAVVAFLPVMIVLGAVWIESRPVDTAAVPTTPMSAAPWPGEPVAESLDESPGESLAESPTEAPTESLASRAESVEDPIELADSPAPGTTAPTAPTEAGLNPAPQIAAEAQASAPEPATGMVDRRPEAAPPAASAATAPEPQQAPIVEVIAASPDAPPQPMESTTERTPEPIADKPAEEEPVMIARARPSTDPPVAEPRPETNLTTASIEDRIQGLLSGYASSFDRGNLDGLLTRLSADPRENENSGRDWFRETYGHLFATSTHRQLLIDVVRIVPDDQHWRVYGEFQLMVSYRGRQRPVSHRAPIRYAIVELEDGRLEIDAIDY